MACAVKNNQLENVVIAKALQLEAAWRRVVPIRFNFVACAKFELAQPILGRLRLFLLLIRYVTLWPWTLTSWPWPLTLNICSVPAVPWSNSVPNMSEIGQSAAKLLQFDLWPLTLNICKCAGCAIVKLCTKYEWNRAICGEVIAVWYLTLWLWTLYHVLRYALG